MSAYYIHLLKHYLKDKTICSCRWKDEYFIEAHYSFVNSVFEKKTTCCFVLDIYFHEPHREYIIVIFYSKCSSCVLVIERQDIEKGCPIECVHAKTCQC